MALYKDQSPLPGKDLLPVPMPEPDQVLTTERLLLRRFTLNDTGFIIRLLNSPGWIQFIGDRQVRTTEEAEHYLLNGPLKSYATLGYGLSLVAIKETLQPIGICGLLKRDGLDDVDIGFAFLPEAQGQGYAWEMVHAVIQHARQQWQVGRVLAIVLPANTRSIHLLRKAGFVFDRKIQFNTNGEELLLFRNE